MAAACASARSRRSRTRPPSAVSAAPSSSTCPKAWGALNPLVDCLGSSHSPLLHLPQATEAIRQPCAARLPGAS